MLGSYGDPTLPLSPETNQMETTGRFLVLLAEDAGDEGVQLLAKATGLSVTSTRETEIGALDAERLRSSAAVFFDKLNVALVSVEPGQLQALTSVSAEGSPILAVEPERVVYALQQGAARRAPLPVVVEPVQEPVTLTEYLQGYRDAVNHLTETLFATGRVPAPVTEEEQVEVTQQAQVTWGLRATGVPRSRYSGRGVRVAVLDTGLDLNHPDFQGRSIVRQSFIPGQSEQDGHGHGTHCIGTACGPQLAPVPPRYGIAYGAEIYVGKVLSNQGSGSDGGILNGINWAITNQCAVVSMSLGAPVLPGQGFSAVFENVARRAQRAGTLIIAAAGNESRRHLGYIAPVGHPANCPSIMAVGAVDSRLQIARFSTRGINPNGGQVDIVGPGVDVYSTWLMPRRYNTISGTSMATPHVAGIAALHAESDPRLRGQGLWNRLTQTARRLVLPAVDVGAGLVQAP